MNVFKKTIIFNNREVKIVITVCLLVFLWAFIFINVGCTSESEIVQCSAPLLSPTTETINITSFQLIGYSPSAVDLDSKLQNTRQFADFSSHKEFKDRYKDTCVPACGDFATPTEIFIFTTLVVIGLLYNAYYT
jgi:hypothetical protein